MTDLKTLFKGVSLKSDGGPFGFGNGPEADWKAIFMGAATLAVLATALNVYIFLKIDKGEIFVVEPASIEDRSLNLEKLRETIVYYQGKAQDFENINNQGGVPIDPSL